MEQLGRAAVPAAASERAVALVRHAPPGARACVSTHGGAPRIEWRNEFAMLVRTAPIQQALVTIDPIFSAFGSWNSCWPARRLQCLRVWFFSPSIGRGRARSIAGRRDGMRWHSRASGFLPVVLHSSPWLPGSRPVPGAAGPLTWDATVLPA